MTPGQRRGWLYGFLVVGVTLCVWALARGVPAWKQTVRLAAEQEELREEAAKLQPPAGASVDLLHQQLTELEAQRQALLDTEIPRASAAQLDAALTHLAETHGLQIEATEAREAGARDVRTTAVRDDTGDDGYAVLRPSAGSRRGSVVGRRITLRGSFGSLRAFLIGLTELPAPPVVDRLAVAHAPADVRGGLLIELEIAQ